jgi:hypothetical protein
MSKLSKPVWETHTDPETWIRTDILQAPRCWTVVRDGEAIAVRTTSTQGPFRYIRSQFPSQAHAERLAERLNQMFRTQQYQVVEIIVPIAR